MKTNVDNLFRARVEAAPEQIAIFGPQRDRTLTYRELDTQIDRVAAELFEFGVRAGDAVGLHLPSGVDYIVHCYAIWRIGACTVPIAIELTPPEKDEICENIAIRFVLSSPGRVDFADHLHKGPPRALSAGHCLVMLDGKVRHPEGFSELNAAFIRFTSGTTGRAKGVVLSHETVSERIHAANEALRIGPDDRVLWVLSMSYHFTVSIVAYLSFGASVVLPRNNFAGAVYDACERTKATVLYASPMHFALLADYGDGKPLSSLRLAISTTTALARDVSERFAARYGVGVSQALGLIEIGLPCINIRHAGQKHGSVGQVLPAYELLLRERQPGSGLCEVFFRGPGILDAYYSPFRKREEILEDGYFATRDVGELDADGCLFLLGRAKDVISVMGMKFFPQEVERVISEHPAVREVAVRGIPHERMGEVALASIVLREPLDEKAREELRVKLRAMCQTRLASYKVPERIEILDELPKTASGKVLRSISP